MFGWRKEEDPFAALGQGGIYQGTPTTAADIGLSDQPASVGDVKAAVPAPRPARKAAVPAPRPAQASC